MALPEEPHATRPLGDLPLPPGPSGPQALHMLRFMRDPLGCQRAYERRYGPVFSLSMPGSAGMVLVTEPELAQRIFATDRDIGQAGKVRKTFLKPLVGEHSLLTLDGEAWVRQRKMLGSAFHGKRVAGYGPQMAAIAGERVAGWPLGEPMPLRPLFQEITLEVILRVVFGVSDTQRLRRLTRLVPPLLRATEAIDTQMLLMPKGAWRRADPLLRRVPGTPNARFAALRDAVDSLIYAEIGERRAETGGHGRTDILSALLAARDADGRGLEDLELRDALVTLLLAGHETTATALAWCCERLTRHPAAHERTRRAVAEGDEDYLEAVAKEALRSRPVVPDMPRQLTEPMELGGYRVPAHWWAAPAALAMQNSGRHFEAPDEFRPERFLQGRAAPDAWMPFGGGRRQCLGAQFALLEMRAILPEILRRVTLHVPAAVGDERLRLSHVTLVPEHDAKVLARKAGGWPRG